MATKNTIITMASSSSSYTSSWPWMKGIEVAVADAIEPVCAEDKRPAVKDLISKHKKNIEKVRAVVSEDALYDEAKHDDLWILRFCLSQKKSKNAIKAALHTMQFRREYNLDENDIRDVPPYKVTEGPLYKYWTTRFPKDAMISAVPDKKRGVLEFIRFSAIDQQTAVENLTYEDHWMAGYVYATEWAFQWLDYTTRTTGRLTKTTRLLDLSGIGLQHTNMQATHRDGKAMAVMEDCYPQTLGSLLLCEAPTWLQVPWKIARPLLPKRVLSKIDFANPKRSEKERARLYQFISEEDLPVYFGGKSREDYAACDQDDEN